ncbi:RNA polymerase sigma factor [bacterium]|nr:RNA polymerase sigma factor [bacterium]
MQAKVLRNLKDTELLDGYKCTGDNNYFQELFLRYQHRIHGSCLKFFPRNHALAEDAVQDAFARALENARFSTINDVAGWLFTIARNSCIDIHRKQCTAPFQSFANDESNLEEDSTTPETQEKNIEIQELIQRINGLNHKQRISIKLYLEGYSYLEIAQITQHSEKEVKSAIQTGKENLRKSFLR